MLCLYSFQTKRICFMFFSIIDWKLREQPLLTVFSKQLTKFRLVKVNLGNIIPGHKYNSMTNEFATRDDSKANFLGQVATTDVADAFHLRTNLLRRQSYTHSGPLLRTPKSLVIWTSPVRQVQISYIILSKVSDWSTKSLIFCPKIQFSPLHAITLFWRHAIAFPWTPWSQK